MRMWCTVYYKAGRPMEIVGGRYGLASKDTTPAQILAVYENLAAPEPKNDFTIGIEDDVTFLSLPKLPELDTACRLAPRCKLWGLGSDGTVGANKNTIKIIGEHTDLYTQAYFVYDSKKSGGLTQSHLRFGKNPIRSAYLVNKADFVACHTPGLCPHLRHGQGPQARRHLPAQLPVEPGGAGGRICPPTCKPGPGGEGCQALPHRRGATSPASLGLGGQINTVLQAAFFKLTNIIPFDQAVTYMKDAISDHLWPQGPGRGGEELRRHRRRRCRSSGRWQIPAAWKTARETEAPAKASVPDFIRDVVEPINRQEGDSLPVSMYA